MPWIHVLVSTNLSQPENPNLQRQWDDIQSSSRYATFKSLLDLHWPSCLSSAAQPNSCAWMNCHMSTTIGTLLDNESFQTAISQILGLPVRSPHEYRCSAMVDRCGLHSLSCRLSAGRLPRLSALNDIIKHALPSAGFNALLEPVGLDRGDGKRPGGMTVFPFSRGKCIIWDSTCVDSLSPSILSPTAIEPGSPEGKGYVMETFFWQSLLNHLAWFDEILTP